MMICMGKMDLLSVCLGFAGGFGLCLAAAFEVHKKLMAKQEARLEACKDLVATYGWHRPGCLYDLTHHPKCTCGWIDILYRNEDAILNEKVRERGRKYDL